MEYNENLTSFKPEIKNNNNKAFTNTNANANATNFMTIKTEYTHNFQDFDKTAEYEEDFEEYYSDEEQENDKTRLTNKASLKEIDDVVS